MFSRVASRLLRPRSAAAHRAISTASGTSCHAEYPFLKELGIGDENPGCYHGTWCGSGAVGTAVNPATGKAIARVHTATPEEYDACLDAMNAARDAWALVPAPKRGDIVRQIGAAMRAKQARARVRACVRACVCAVV